MVRIASAFDVHLVMADGFAVRGCVRLAVEDFASHKIVVIYTRSGKVFLRMRKVATRTDM